MSTRLPFLLSAILRLFARNKNRIPSIKAAAMPVAIMKVDRGSVRSGINKFKIDPEKPTKNVKRITPNTSSKDPTTYRPRYKKKMKPIRICRNPKNIDAMSDQ